MIEPQFLCGSLNYSVEHPSGWEREVLVGSAENVTLGGVNTKDIVYRKYQYVLKWEAISLEDYEKLEAIYLAHLDQEVPVTFAYRKWESAFNGVDCMMKMSKQGFVGGSGETGYYSNITVTLAEVDNR